MTTSFRRGRLAGGDLAGALRRGWLVVLLALAVAGLNAAQAEPPSDPIPSFTMAKRIARDVIYKDHRETLYCGCIYEPNERGTGGVIGNLECGYEPRRNPTRGRQLEWEHIMPAAVFGRGRSCWDDGHRVCTDSNGRGFRGRRCCAKIDEEFQRIEADLHNLAPAVGELNGDRSDKPYAMVDGEERLYGACDFEVNTRKRRAEPFPDVRGDVARVWFYMSDTYEVDIEPEIRQRLTVWDEEDPPDAWERERDGRIAAEQGNRNPFIGE